MNISSNSSLSDCLSEGRASPLSYHSSEDNDRSDDDPYDSQRNSHNNGNRSQESSSGGPLRSTKKSRAYLKRSQLTRRVALYVPPYLQRHQQEAIKSQNNSSNDRASTSQATLQPKLNQSQYLKMKEIVKNYQLRQFAAVSVPGKSRSHEKSRVLRNRKNHGKLPDMLWTREMQDLLNQKSNLYKKFMKSGCHVSLIKSKQIKVKLRALVRLARSRMKPTHNPYKAIAIEHAKKYGEEDVSHHDEDVSGDDEEEVVLAGSISDVSSNDDEEEEEYDSSYYYSVTRRMGARLEWSQAILDFNSDPTSLRSHGMVKEEVVDSDVESDNVIEEEGVSSRQKSSRMRDFSGSESRRTPSAPDTTLDRSENEYLNQQFLRRQHDYEREQKFHQFGLESRGREQSLFSSRNDSRTNFLSDRTRESSVDSFDRNLQDYRLHDLNRYKNNTSHQDFDTLLSQHSNPVRTPSPIVGNVSSLEKQPEEPFRDSVRFQKPPPLSIAKERFVSQDTRNERNLSYSDGYARNYTDQRKTSEALDSNQRLPNYTFKRHPSTEITNSIHGKRDSSTRLSPYSERKALRESPVPSRYPREFRSPVPSRYPREVRSELRSYPLERRQSKSPTFNYSDNSSKRRISRTSFRSDEYNSNSYSKYSNNSMEFKPTRSLDYPEELSENRSRKRRYIRDDSPLHANYKRSRYK